MFTRLNEIRIICIQTVIITIVNAQTEKSTVTLQSSSPSSDPKLSSSIINSFHVRVNTIIRTQDSRNLGAKYLNESEFKTSEDCFNWCLLQSPCNLAVYEERVSHFII